MSSAIDENPLDLNDDDLFVAFRFPGESNHKLLVDEGSSTGEFEFTIQPFIKKPEEKVIIKSNRILENKSFHFSTVQGNMRRSTPKDQYYKVANSLIHKMNHTSLNKVVLSRIKLVENYGVNCYHLFVNLTEIYPEAFVFFYNIPGKGAWIGATPEILYENYDGLISTVALAATQKVNGRKKNEVTWNAKEIEEQAIIQRFIESNLDELHIPFQKSPTTTIQAGNVFHLKTSYFFEDIIDRNLVLDRLHPGPAICGFPQEDALNEILSNEAHQRNFYCGYLGLKSGNSSRYYINLRSMQIFKDQFALFVGGGLTKDSEVSSEWEETELKSKTLESVIQKSYEYATNVE